MRCRRALRTLLVFVLLGIIATYLTAWMLHEASLWRATRVAGHLPWQLSARHSNAGQPTPGGHRVIGPWAEHRRVPEGLAWAGVEDAQFLWRTSWSARGWEAHVEGIAVGDQGGYAPRGTHERMIWYRIGWPLPTVTMAAYNGLFLDGPVRRVETSTPGVSLGGGVQVLPWAMGPMYHTPQLYPRRDVSARTAIPLRPIWPGFLLNVIFYALLLFFAWRTPGVLRRAVRRRRGRCVGCGYSRDGLEPGAACPECGAG